MKIIVFVFSILLVSLYSSENTNNQFTRINKKEIVIDNKKQLMWQDYDDNQLLLTWQDAKTHCSNSNFLQFNNWRLPTIDELLSIVEYKKTEPAIKEQFEYTNYQWDLKDIYIYGTYWSSTNKTIIHKGLQIPINGIYTVYFRYGISILQAEIDYEHLTKSYVRCVRNIKGK